MLESISPQRAEQLYGHYVILYEKLIKNFLMQGKLHETAEIHLRLAELYTDKLDDLQKEEEHIRASIEILDNESQLLNEFNETRKLTQNLQNIAELYLRIADIDHAVDYYEKVILISKELEYYDLLSFSYQQIASCLEEVDEYKRSKEIMLDGIDFFTDLYLKYDKKNSNLNAAQIAQILKNLHKITRNEEQYVRFTKREAGAYIQLAEQLEKQDENYQKIARYYRGAGLCYVEINANLIEAASCFVLAANYSDKIEDVNEAAINYLDAANVFKDIENWDMTYRNFVKAGDKFWQMNNVHQSTECYLNAYDIAMESGLEFNRFGIFNQIIRGLNKVAREGLKNQEFFTAASLILESIKFYQQLDGSEDFLLYEMVRNVYKYYYRAANLKKIGYSHIVHSYVIASISSILIGKIGKARKILSEIQLDGKTTNDYKELVNKIIDLILEGKRVRKHEFPYYLRRLIDSSEEITYLMTLF